MEAKERWHRTKCFILKVRNRLERPSKEDEISKKGKKKNYKKEGVFSMKDGKFHGRDISKLHFPNSFKTFWKGIRSSIWRISPRLCNSFMARGVNNLLHSILRELLHIASILKWEGMQCNRLLTNQFDLKKHKTVATIFSMSCRIMHPITSNAQPFVKEENSLKVEGVLNANKCIY